MKITIEISKKEIAAAANCAFEMGASSDPGKDIETIMSTDMIVRNNYVTARTKGSTYTVDISDDFLCKIIKKLIPIFGICKNVYFMCKSLFAEIKEDMGETIVIDNHVNNEDTKE